jgi:hypothetical protein
MGLICLADSASEKGRAVWRHPSVRSIRKVGIIHERPPNVGIHTVSIYRCCTNCGKGDTPLSKRKHCEVCGDKLPRIGKCQKTK